MTPAEYVNEIVVPTLREFSEERRSRRRAYLACIAAFHIKDHLKEAGIVRPEKAVAAAHKNEWEAVRDVCNGTKHVASGSFRVGRDWDRPPGLAGVMECGVSQLGDTAGGREITLGNNRMDLYWSVKRVLGAFCDKFPAHLGGCDLSDC
jgi:hypothetical protein